MVMANVLPIKSKRVGRYNRAPQRNKNCHYAVTLRPENGLNDSCKEVDEDSCPEYRTTEEIAVELPSTHKTHSHNLCSKLFLSSRKEFRIVKAGFSIFISIVVGISLYYAFIFGYQYETKVAGGIALTATILMALFFSLSIKARCLGTLTIPSLCTARGRTAILSVITGLLLMGPMINITHNLKNVAYSLGCSIQMTQNLSEQIHLLYSQPATAVLVKVEPALLRLKAQEESFRNDLESLKVFINDLDKEPSDSQLCQQQMNRVYKVCEWQLDQVKAKCKSNLNNKLLKNSRLCNLEESKNSCRKRLKNMCFKTVGTSQRVNKIQKSIKSLEKLLDLSKTDVQLTYNTSFYPGYITANQSTQTFYDVYNYIQSKAQTAIYIIRLIQVIGKACSMSVILLLVQSFLYLREYLTKDTFDNCYITRKMKAMDSNNRANHKPAILPLRKAERRNYIDSTTFRLSKQEKAQFNHGLATLCLHIVAGSIVCIFDYFLFWVMDVMQSTLIHDDDHTPFNATSPVHDIRVSGSGYLAHILKELVAILINNTHRENIKPCMAKPSEPPYTKYYVIAAAYVVAFILVWTQAYFMRLRRKVVAYFYPERDDERNRYLIDHILRKRQDFTKRLTRNIQRTVRQRRRERKERMNVVADVRKLLVTMFCWKVKSPSHCVVCNDVDRGTFYRCSTTDCNGVYCRECFGDVRNVCQLCFVHETV